MVAPLLPVSSWRSRPSLVWWVVQEQCGRPRLRRSAVAAATVFLLLSLSWLLIRAASPALDGDYSSSTCSGRGVPPADMPSSAPRSRWLWRVAHAATPTGLTSVPYRPARVVQRSSSCSPASSGCGGATVRRWTTADLEEEDGGVGVALALLAVVVLSAVAAAPQLVGAAKADHSLGIIQKDIIQTVNNHPNAGWTAGHNPYFANYTIEQFKHILGVKPTPPGLLAGVPIKTHPKSTDLPKEFDARTQWSSCSTIGNILDQGHCGACWAFGAVECLQDRFCIHLNMSVSLSVNDLLACCGFLCGSGCNGGYPISAWRYFRRSGIVTEECDPYFDQTGCQHPGCEPAYPTPKCQRKCKVQNQVWKEKKHFSVNAYRVHSDPHDIMAEVYKNGPVEVAFAVYEDFAHYKSGVYKHITGGVMGGHAVKLIGWGTSDAGEDYWLLANQWNRGWGDDGYFKIIRGKNECGIEEDVTAGMPSTKNTARNNYVAFGTAIL